MKLLSISPFRFVGGVFFAILIVILTELTQLEVTSSMALTGQSLLLGIFSAFGILFFGVYFILGLLIFPILKNQNVFYRFVRTGLSDGIFMLEYVFGFLLMAGIYIHKYYGLLSIVVLLGALILLMEMVLAKLLINRTEEKIN